jgi:dTDP-3-amino-3,4,6-trideoxy-alpha-D-glucose transaminase
VPVPLFATSLDAYKPRLTEKLAEVVQGGRFILGPEVQAFEEEFAGHLGVRHCIGVANGTDAITIALRALGVAPGDEVVCPSYTFYASVEAIVNAGAVPAFCDVDPETACVTVEMVEAAVTPRTKAIVAVHLFGGLAPVPELRALGLPVLEDAAQAAGAALAGERAGSLGDAATFSFFPSKNLPCLGDGGAIVTDDDEVALLARRLRFHGSDDKRTFVEVGYNSRLDELQAAALRVLLPELDGWTAARRRAAAAYEREGIGEHVAVPRAIEGAEHAYHLYVVRSERADELAARLAGRGIGARAYYRVPVHRQPAMRAFADSAPELPGTDAAARTGLALPMGTALSDEAVREVVDACASGST